MQSHQALTLGRFSRSYQPVALWGSLLCLGSLAPGALAQEVETSSERQSSSQGSATVGALVPDHEFVPLVGHDGLTRLSELRGHPVIIAGVSQNLKVGMNAGWVAKDLGHKYAKDGLVIILEDQRAWTMLDHPSRIQAMWMKFFSAKAWFTTHLDSRNADVPILRKQSKRNESSLILIGVDGKLVLEGTAEKASEAEKKSDYRVAFQRAVAAELKRKKKGWGPTPKVRKVRAAAYGKGNLGAAWKALQSAEGSMDPADATALRKELAQAFAHRMKSLRYLIDKGRVQEAQRIVAQLRKSVRGVELFEEPLAGIVDEMGSKEMQAELKLDRKLQKILKRVSQRQYAKFGFEGIAQVRAFAKQHEESSVGAGAARMDSLLMHLVAYTKGVQMKHMEEKLAKK